MKLNDMNPAFEPGSRTAFLGNRPPAEHMRRIARFIVARYGLPPTPSHDVWKKVYERLDDIHSMAGLALLDLDAIPVPPKPPTEGGR